MRDHLNVFGGDYDTPDGTCLRDYIHVLDLANGHVLAIEKLKEQGLFIYNLGTEQPTSVLGMVQAFERANGLTVKYEITPRREGDVPVCYADASRAKKELGWSAKYDIEDMCRDSWNWQKNNPNGY